MSKNEIGKYVRTEDRCPDCHRFTVWFNDGKSKHQCLMCELIRKEKEKVKEETI